LAKAAFPNLSHYAFTHEKDLESLRAVKALPGVDTILKRFISSSENQTWLLSMKYNFVRVNEAQYPTIYKLVADACECLSISIPKIYINSDPTFNAFAAGVDDHVMVINRGLIDSFSNEELSFIIGHELGHIKCNHMLYNTAMQMIGGMGESATSVLLVSVPAAVVGAVLVAALQRNLARWSRAAEYSCDRAGLLVVQDANVAASTLAKLGGFSNRLSNEFSLNQYLKQCSDIEDPLDTVNPLEPFNSHPDTVYRAVSIFEWFKSDQYQKLMKGEFLSSQEFERLEKPRIEGRKYCGKCNEPIDDSWSHCFHCGTATQERAVSLSLDDSTEMIQCNNCNSLIQEDWTFCNSCGSKIEPMLGGSH